MFALRGALTQVPRPVTVAMPDIAVYEKEAAAIGYRPDGLDRAYLVAMLQRVGCEIYDLAEVTRFLQKMAPKDHSPYWVGLTEKDACSRHGAGVSCDQLRHFRGPYKQIIPIEAIRTVARVKVQDPTVSFYISDYREVRKDRAVDPFLMVVTRCGVEAVIFHWDEPAWEVRRGGSDRG